MPSKQEITELVLHKADRSALEALDDGLLALNTSQHAMVNARTFVAKAIVGFGHMVQEVRTDDGQKSERLEAQAIDSICIERWNLLREKNQDLPAEPPDYTLVRKIYGYWCATPIAVGLFAGTQKPTKKLAARQYITWNGLTWYAADQSDVPHSESAKTKIIGVPNADRTEYLFRREILDESDLLAFVARSVKSAPDKILSDVDLKDEVYDKAFFMLGSSAQKALKKQDLSKKALSAAKAAMETGSISDSNKTLVDDIKKIIAQRAAEVGVTAEGLMDEGQREAYDVGDMLMSEPDVVVKTTEHGKLFDQIWTATSRLSKLVMQVGALGIKPPAGFADKLQAELRTLAQAFGLALVQDEKTVKPTEPPEPSNGKGHGEREEEEQRALQPAN